MWPDYRIHLTAQEMERKEHEEKMEKLRKKIAKLRGKHKDRIYKERTKATEPLKYC